MIEKIIFQNIDSESMITKNSNINIAGDAII